MSPAQRFDTRAALVVRPRSARYFGSLGRLAPIVTGLLAAMLFTPLHAQTPTRAPTQPSIAPRESGERLFVAPRTAWAARGQLAQRATIERIRAARHNADPSAVRAMLVPSRAGGAVEGTLVEAGVVVNFPGEGAGTSAPALTNQLFGPGTADSYSVSRYYSEVSHGLFTVAGTVAGAINVPQSSSYYVGDRRPDRYSGVADQLPEFLTAVVQQADATIDFRPYVDPADPHHRVAALVIITAGKGGQCVNDHSHIWAHRYNMTAVFGKPYITRSTTAAGDSIVIDDYVVIPVRDCDGVALDGLGVLMHETGHLTGLPDLYDTQSSVPGDPVGTWDLMSLGNWQTPQTPAWLGAWSRVVLGWDIPTIVDLPDGSAPRDITLPPAPAADGVVLIPFANSDEFALLEVRAHTGSDRATLGVGLLAWYVNPAVLLGGLPTNAVNVDLTRPGVAVVQADGALDLEHGRNAGDAGDPFPGSKNVQTLSASTTPAMRSRITGAPAGELLESITFTGTGSAARATLRVRMEPTAPATFAIAPDTLPWLLFGEPTTIQLQAVASMAAVARPTVSWSADSASLTDIGLTLDATTGVLRGTPRLTAPLATLRVRAADRASGAVSTMTYQVHVVQPVALAAGPLVTLLLRSRTQPVPQNIVAYIDGLGNQNGVFDVGDLLILARRGRITLNATTLASVSRRTP